MARENDGSSTGRTPVRSLISQTISVFVTFNSSSFTSNRYVKEPFCFSLITLYWPPGKLFRMSFFTNLMHKFFIVIHLLHSSTCFEKYYAHLQEDNCINTASGIVILFGWLFSTQVTRGKSRLLTCALNCHPKTVTLPDAVLIQLSSWRWAQYCSKHVEECNKCINL